MQKIAYISMLKLLHAFFGIYHSDRLFHSFLHEIPNQFCCFWLIEALQPLKEKKNIDKVN